ncbi:MAG: 4Fe-4S dicluster domain-containing protein [Candidatus Helarchaeota archaeon]
MMQTQTEISKPKRTPRYQIKVDKKLCGDPIACGLRCVRACPYNLLAYTQRKTPKKGEEPKRFKIVSAFTIMCNKCNRCINACPVNAITIKLKK